MVNADEVVRQFHRLNVRPSIWVRAEVKELTRVLVPGEQITHIVAGWYENGFALLCCTDQRVLLIDKKPFFFKMEDLRYDKISEVRYLNRLLDSTVVLSYAGMRLDFKSWNQAGLRKLMEYVQEAIMKLNQQQWRPAENQYQQETVQRRWPASQPQAAGLAYELSEPEQPEDLAKLATADLGLARNPYAPTTKYLRRRVPKFSFTESSRL